MTTIDELGQRAAAAAHADAAEMAATRVDAGLERLRLGDAPVVPARRQVADPRRWVMLGAAVALTAAAIVALAINASGGESRRVVPGVSSTQVTTESISVAPTSVATTDEPITTEAPILTPDDAITVAHDALPPAYPATAFVSVDAPADPTRLPLVGIGESTIVTVDSDTSTATLIDRLSPGVTPPQQLPLQVRLSGADLLVGPGDVLYGVIQGATPSDPLMSIVAIALSGDRAGQVVATAPIDAAAFVEAPRGVLGHFVDGIIDRRTSTTLLGYVDATGASISLDRESHAVATIAGDVAGGDVNFVLRDPDGAHDWHLAVQRDPTSPYPYNGQSPAAPSSHGGAVVWTAVGPPDDPSFEQPTPTEPVIAVLAADGTGAWYSLTDGWQVAASDIDGTILARRTDNAVELATVDPPQRFDFVNQPAAPHQRALFASTLPTALTTAARCTANDLEVVPSSDGAMGTTYGVLLVRNRTNQPCEVRWVPLVDLLDNAGNVIQSTASANLYGNADAPGVVLEPDSWATAQLGPISNICGGNESSQLRLTIDSSSATVPFAVGGPVDPNSCDPSTQAPSDGTLGVQPFAAIEPNPDQPGTFDNLTVSLDAPNTVRAGEVLRYDLVVNAAGDPQVISDYNCPIYTETLATATGQFLLPCNGSDGILISTGESVRFHIELQIPANAATGQATLTWTPVEPSGPPVTATVTIVS